MSDYSSMATLQNNSPTASFAAALQRAKLVAAKLEGGGSKRPLESDGPEPIAKKLASVVDFQPQQQQNMSVTAAAAAARIGANAGPAPPQPPNMMADQAINEYIRVPDKMVGLIIGRGGEQITRLQAESGCKIQMAPDSGGQPDRLCTLTGSREAITRAKELVNQIVNHRGRENAPHEGPGGPPMPPSSRGPGSSGSGSMGGMSEQYGGPPMAPSNHWGNNAGGGLGATEEIMLPGPKVGLIIGKNGKTIKQLQEQSGAKMVVIQDGPNTEYEKPLRISGDPQKVEHAKQLVFELLMEKEGGGGGGGGGGGSRGGYDDPYSPHDQGNGLGGNSTEVLVPKIAVGVVIGRGGDMIKKIQAETGARVQFHQERDDGPSDKRCYLQGKPHQVEKARQMIEDLIASVNRRDQESRQGGGGRMRGGGGGGGGGGGQRNGDRGDYQWQDQPDVKVTFTVSNVKCGLIIGRGGEVIKQINAQSGAHCELDRRASNNNGQGGDRNNRTFFIRGHPDAVEACKRIICEKVGMPVNFMLEGGCGGGGGAGDYYSGGGGGGPGAAPPAWGYNPHWLTQQPQPQQPQVPINPATGQPDYSQQWIDYYRSMGLTREAEAVEQSKQQQAAAAAAASGGPAPASNPGPSPSQPQPAPQQQSAPGGGGAPQADYSAQWAEYYRSIGKMKEAEAIEAQMKLKQQQSQPQTQPQPAQPPQQPTPPASTPSGGPMGAPYGQQYGMYGGYGGYAPYQYQQPQGEQQ